VARYSSRERRWYGRPVGPARRNVTLPEGSGDAREWHTELPGGRVRVDIGEPIRRLASEPQAVLVGSVSPKPRKAAPAAAPAAPPAAPSDGPRVRPPRRRKEHRAITRD